MTVRSGIWFRGLKVGSTSENRGVFKGGKEEGPQPNLTPLKGRNGHWKGSETRDMANS